MYRHWKGRLYEVVCLCRHEDNRHEMVVYRDGQGTTWVRDLWQWTQVVTTKKGRVPRYTLVEPAGRAAADDRQNDEQNDEQPAGLAVEERGPEY